MAHAPLGFLRADQKGIGASMQLKRPLPGWSAFPVSKRPKFLLALTSSTPLILALAGCSGGVLDPQGPIGAGDSKILLNALAAMLTIVVPTIVGTLIFAWWFRASNRRARYQPGFVYSGRLELVVWAIPILTVNFLGGVIWMGAHDLDPYKPIAGQKDPLDVQVVSLDWKWLFIYPDQGIASVNELTVPAGVPVHFSLTSATVMNAFFVPQLGTMIAAMPRMVTQLNLEASHPGDFYGQSTQFSGDGFSGMHFTVHAVSGDAFAQWVAKTQEAGPWLDRAGYLDLLHESQNVRPFTYQSVEPGLFDDIVTGRLPFGEGPGAEGTGPPFRPGGAK
jgi:cytochrome o ubiquinol oxidase subunit II